MYSVAGSRPHYFIGNNIAVDPGWNFSGSRLLLSKANAAGIDNADRQNL
jgi:hypothetical protein